MRLLVYPHQLVVGGSQINAIELAAKVRDRGHEVTVIAPAGPLEDMIEELRLPYVRTAASGYYPSPRTARQLLELVRARRIDLVHAYEWRPALEATFGPHLRIGTPLLNTVLSMSVPRFLPRHVPLVVGTRELADRSHTAKTYLMEPPIDTTANCSRDPAAARARWGLAAEEVVLAVVCRMTPELDKLPGVLEAIEAVGNLAAQCPVRLLAVGGGEGLAEVEAKAQEVNARLGRPIVIVAGQVMDPREAYDAADIVLGMGSSVLRGMAFSRPVVVQGTSGYWRLLDEGSLPTFLEQGWFGHGGGGARALEEVLSPLVDDRSRRHVLGTFARKVVIERFALDAAADQLVRIYTETVARRCGRAQWGRSMSRSAASVAKFAAHRLLTADGRRAAPRA